MKKKTKFVAIPLLLGVVLVGGAASVFAFSPADITGAAFENFSAEEREAIQKAFEIRQAAEEEARDVLDEAGLSEEEIREAIQAAHEAAREKLEAALEANDYESFVELSADAPFADSMNEDLFDKMVEAHDLRESGDEEGAREIMKGLGLEKGGFGSMMGKGHMRGDGE